MRSDHSLFSPVSKVALVMACVSSGAVSSMISIARGDLTPLGVVQRGSYGASAEDGFGSTPRAVASESFDVGEAGNVDHGPTVLDVRQGPARGTSSFNYHTVWTPNEIRGSDSMAVTAEWDDPDGGGGGDYEAGASGAGQSTFSYSFNPTEDECWTLTFTVSGTGGVQVFADDGDDSIFGAGTGPNQTTVSGTVSYLYLAGQDYGFRIGASAGANTVVPVLNYAADASSWSFVFSRGGNCCDPDVNQDGNADQGDVDYLIDVVAGGENSTGIDPDFNHDGNVDQGDVDALINVVAGGGCP